MRFKDHLPIWVALFVGYLIFSFGVMGCNTALAEDGIMPPAKAVKGAVPCPKTKMVKNCLVCHVTPGFQIKEADPDDLYEYPGYGKTKIRHFPDGTKYGYFFLTDIDSNDLHRFFDYTRRHDIKRVKLEIFSPGGSVMHAWRIVGIIQKYQAEGGIVETEVSGFAASAGFLVFVSGTKGHRVASPNAELMWHEVISFKLFDISSPSDKEDEARVLRHFQDNSNTFLADRSNLAKADIDKLIRKREFWMTGRQALGYGFADGLLGE